MKIHAVSGLTEPGTAPGLGINTRNVLALAKQLQLPIQEHKGDSFDSSGSLAKSSYYTSHAELKATGQFLQKNGIDLFARQANQTNRILAVKTHSLYGLRSASPRVLTAVNSWTSSMSSPERWRDSNFGCSHRLATYTAVHMVSSGKSNTWTLMWDVSI
jgi:hypothetical protein